MEEWEKTQYWERMMFVIEVPSISDTIQGNELNLTIGGVRALNHESLFSKKSIEKFKVFIGFNNKVCTNLLVSTDGIILEDFTPDIITGDFYQVEAVKMTLDLKEVFIIQGKGY